VRADDSDRGPALPPGAGSEPPEQNAPGALTLAGASAPPERTLGFGRATGVGVGAVVGGGILVLAGDAFATAGPSALLALVLNAVVAGLTALCFAELAAAFPENGGVYAYARKILGLRPAFGVGWVLWFAHIVAAVLYALGFAEYALATLRQALGDAAPAWASGRAATLALAVGAASADVVRLSRGAGGSDALTNWGKVLVFVTLGALGLAALAERPDDAVRDGLTPFFTGGWFGVVQVMGLTFITLQGFEVIGAVAGEVKRPERTIPRAMLAALGVGVLAYLPLLFAMATAGVPPGSSLAALARRDPPTAAARLVATFLGPVGLWLILVAGVLATLSALRANLLVASRVALSMARDRTLPSALAVTRGDARAPAAALLATLGAVIAVALLVPDLAAAGAAASLIFLLCFTMGHGLAWLARSRRPTDQALGFRAPFFPLLPLVGGVSCAGLAVVQAVTVPAAGGVTLAWLAFGGLLYTALFAARATMVDASATARDPELLLLRGRSPVVLVPTAHPERARALVAVASALAPPSIGRVMLLHVVDPSERAHGDPVDNAGRTLGEALRAALGAGHRPRALLSVSEEPWQEIRRVAEEYRCHSVLLGPPPLTERGRAALEDLVNTLGGGASFLFADARWDLATTRRLIVPVGGRGRHHTLRARVVAALLREVPECSATWLRALPAHTPKSGVEAATRALAELGEDVSPGRSTVRAAATPGPSEFLLEGLGASDLLLLGLGEVDGRFTFGELLPALISKSPCPCLVLGRDAEGPRLGQLARGAAERLAALRPD
jgi:amino acid transporter